MNKIKLLMIDDDKMFLTSSKAFLKIVEELDIECIVDPIQALEYARNNKTDIVFVDYYMPQMKGDEFVSKLREFNDDVLVILQTGFSDTYPPVTMLQNMNIQGYFDKTKPPEELELIVRSTIKTYKLIQLIKQKDKEIDMLNYKNEFMGGLIVGITDSMKNQTMTIGGAKEIIKETLKHKKINECNDMINKIENSLKKETDLLGALDFYTNQQSDLNKIIETVSILSRVKLLMDKTTFSHNISKNTLVKCKSNILIMILLEIIVYLSGKVEKVEIEGTQADKNIIKVLNQFGYDSNFINRITTISNEDDSIEINYNNDDKTLKIYVENLECFMKNKEY